MSLRTFLARKLSYPKRYYTTGSKFIESTRDKDTGIDIISMSRPPVNSLNTELLSILKTSLLDAQNNSSKGIILTSSLPTIFSAGLDITEMYNRDINSLTKFWNTLQDTWFTLYNLNIPTTAAINGSSPAGGCLLAMSTEYRVFLEGTHTMGLNETKLGIVAPKWFNLLYISLIGQRKAELALLRGTLFKPERALQIGLVDELATNKADAIEKCKQYILSFENIPAIGRAATKSQMRNDIMQWLKENRESDTDMFVKFIQSPKVQTGLKYYLEYLKQKKQ